MEKKIKYYVVMLIAILFAVSINSCHPLPHPHPKTNASVEGATILDDQEKPLKDWVNCRVCNGKGICQNCNGKGKVKSKDCISCNGTGKCSVCSGEGGYRAN